MKNLILYLNESARNNLSYARTLKGVKDKNEIDNALKVFDLYERRRTVARHFSLGMKQRLALSIALLGKPELLLLDEPLNGLDPSGIKEVEAILLNACREYGTAVFISSHYLKQLYGFATDYIILNNGRAVEKLSAQ